MKGKTFRAVVLQRKIRARVSGPQNMRETAGREDNMAGDFTRDAGLGPLDEDGHDASPLTEEEQRRMALQNILDAWDDSLGEGVDADILATTAIFAALSDMVEAYGEEAVAEMANGLADRVRQGEFTLNRTLN
jgi:hypothetical protein